MTGGAVTLRQQYAGIKDQECIVTVMASSITKNLPVLNFNFYAARKIQLAIPSSTHRELNPLSPLTQMWCPMKEPPPSSP
jgi:hypothetical protein